MQTSFDDGIGISNSSPFGGGNVHSLLKLDKDSSPFRIDRSTNSGIMNNSSLNSNIYNSYI